MCDSNDVVCDNNDVVCDNNDVVCDDNNVVGRPVLYLLIPIAPSGA